MHHSQPVLYVMYTYIASELYSQEGTTQGNHLAMAMYAIAITPLINNLESELLKQIWYADDTAAGGKLSHLKAWWDRLTEVGPDYGYYPNASKSWLIVKEEHLPAAEMTFRESGFASTKEGRRYLGEAIVTRTFVETYAKEKNIGVDTTSRTSLLNCNFTATCSLPCFHERLSEQMDFSLKNNPQC